MKKLLFLLAPVAVGAFSPVLAQGTSQRKTPGVYVTQVAPLPDATPFVWRLNLKAGQKWFTTTNTSSQISQQMPATPGAKTGAAPLNMETITEMHVLVEQNVLSSDEKGARVEVTYREIRQNTKAKQGDKVIYDSANPPAGMKGLADISKSLVGAKISYLLSPSGEISEIAGIEEYLDRLSQAMEKGIEGTPGAAAMQKTMRATLAATLSPEAIQTSFGAAYRAMPTVPVAPGGTWKTATLLPMMGTTFTQNSVSTFVSRRGNLISISQKGDFATDAGAEFKVPLGAARDPKTPAPVSQLDLRGTTSGEIVVDEQSGLMLVNNSTQEIEGEIVMSGLTGKGSTLSIPMRMKTKIVATTQEIKTTP